ncbi:nuclease [Mycoplasmopsis canis]|uniref:MnuA family membrane nuclease n=1 Tax=Mycoplasmopsis canis TaxID=29555 RepID=UPI0006245EBF|nr:nuclease [Mycoplasmopsis canis]AKF40877.1 nuclease [Mycoplasmopsis canis]
MKSKKIIRLFSLILGSGIISASISCNNIQSEHQKENNPQTNETKIQNNHESKIDKKEDKNHSINEVDNKPLNNEKTTNQNDFGDSVLIGSWNIQNISNKTAIKDGFRLNAIADILKEENIKLLSIQELSGGESEAIERLVDLFNKKFNENFKLRKSKIGVKSKSRPNSIERQAVIYDPDNFESISNSETEIVESFYGKTAEFVRPLWNTYWKNKANDKKFWIINGHLDSPGAKKDIEKKANELEGIKWKSSQGEQEVKEFLDIHNAFNFLKEKFYKSLDTFDSMIFNGDTNIKTKNFKDANDYYINLGYEVGYSSFLEKNIDDYKTSLGKNENYSHPYDKFIILDKTDSIDQLPASKFKYDIIKAFKKQETINKYKEKFENDYKGKTASTKSMIEKISDHTLVKISMKNNR